MAAAHVAAVAAAAEVEIEILGRPASSDRSDLSAHGGARVRLSAGMVTIVRSGDFLSFHRPRSDVAVEESDVGARTKEQRLRDRIAEGSFVQGVLFDCRWVDAGFDPWVHWGDGHPTDEQARSVAGDTPTSWDWVR